MFELLHAVDYQLKPGIDEVPDRRSDRLRARREVVDRHKEIEAPQVPLRYADGDFLSIWLCRKSSRLVHFPRRSDYTSFA